MNPTPVSQISRRTEYISGAVTTGRGGRYKVHRVPYLGRYHTQASGTCGGIAFDIINALAPLINVRQRTQDGVRGYDGKSNQY